MTTARPRRLRAAALSVRSARRARRRSPSAHDGGVVDLSIGTPCDPPPPAVIDALASERCRTVVSAEHRVARPARGGPAVDAAAIRRRCSGDRHRGDGRHQGVRHHAAAVDEPADTDPRHGAVPGGVVSLVRDGRRTGPLSGGTGAGTAGRTASTSRSIAPDDVGARPAAVGEQPEQPDRGARRSRCRGRLGTRPRRARVLRRVLRRVHVVGPRPHDPRTRHRRRRGGPLACRSVPISPGCVSASTPATPNSSTTCRKSASTSG